ncbi:putative myosin-2 heavy chain isoform X1 [Sesbania bispinosa]|nr:putative myosin-2 heavy chain isoform X1 [Sesbania bispinosa]
MDESTNDESLLARIRQLEQERDELRKDIEQLCMQQAGPGYLAVATRMHFQRTAGLEQEIESLKKKLAACTRENLNLQEELSEAYRIKSQLADLHSAEVSKNMEAEKQVKFFQGCVAAAFAERDQAIIEAEKAKEKEEETMSQQLNDIHNRVEELTSDCLKLKEFNNALQIDQAVHIEQNEKFKKVINKFFQIRQYSQKQFEDTSWDEKCTCQNPDILFPWLLDYAFLMLVYIQFGVKQSALEEQLERVRNSVDYLQNKLRVGLEIENHLKRRVNALEKKQIFMDKVIESGIADLKHYHSKCRDHIMNLLSDGQSNIKSTINVIDEKVRRFDQGTVSNLAPQSDTELEEHECRDVHISPQAKPLSESKRNGPSSLAVEAGGKGDASNALAMALQEKVAALLLLSQQEERHLLERNVNSALQRKIEDLQRNLLQVTNEKVKALLELAQLKQEHQLLLEKLGHETKQGKGVVDTGERRLVTHESDGALRNLLKKSYLRRWIGPLDVSGNEADSSSPNNEGKLFSQKSSSVDFARMKIENATLKESLGSMEHLTSSIHRLRLSLLKAKESVSSEGTVSGVSEVLNDIISEAKLLRTALGSSLPISWSVETDIGYAGDSVGSDIVHQKWSDEKIDTVSAAGLEMVELLIFAAQMLRDMQTNMVADTEVL